jgi:hypothetical protein
MTCCLKDGSAYYICILADTVRENHGRKQTRKGDVTRVPTDSQITFEMMTKLPRIFVNGLNLVPNSTKVHNPLDETQGY